jgi:hypothetical protein
MQSIPHPFWRPFVYFSVVVWRILCDSKKAIGWWAIPAALFSFLVSWIIHFYAIKYFPNSKGYLGEPMSSVLLAVVYTLVPLGAIVLVVAITNSVMAPSRIYYEPKNRLSRFYKFIDLITSRNRLQEVKNQFKSSDEIFVAFSRRLDDLRGDCLEKGITPTGFDYFKKHAKKIFVDSKDEIDRSCGMFTLIPSNGGDENTLYMSVRFHLDNLRLYLDRGIDRTSNQATN